MSKTADLMSLPEIAADLSMPLRAVREMALAGAFGAFLKVNQKNMRVPREAFEAWKATRWIKPNGKPSKPRRTAKRSA